MISCDIAGYPLEEVPSSVKKEINAAPVVEEAPAVETTRYVFIHEGQTLEIPLDLGAEDVKVRQLLSTFLPLAKNGEIERSEPDPQGTVIITIAQYARPKGLRVSGLALEIHQKLTGLKSGKLVTLMIN